MFNAAYSHSHHHHHVISIITIIHLLCTIDLHYWHDCFV